MATFTLRLSEAIEDVGDIGLNEYPIFDETYRPILNQKITDHYFMREIGFETVEVFRLAVKRRMNEIMPKYNRLYNIKLDFNPLETIGITNKSSGTSQTSSDSSTTTSTTATGNSESSNETSGAARSVNSDTPQGMLSGNANYASSASDTNSQTSVTGTGTSSEANAGEAHSDQTGNSQSDVESTTTGFQGDRSLLLSNYLSIIDALNIDVQIIEELSDLFLSVLSNQSSYSAPNIRWASGNVYY